jgi:alpha-glucosidase
MSNKTINRRPTGTFLTSSFRTLRLIAQIRRRVVGLRLASALVLGACLLAGTLSAQVSVEALPNGATTPDAITTLPSADQTWWKHAVIYEIYPRSFGDTNGDGIGDLNGIIEHLDYLQGLGVDAIWIAPMYPSPQVDFGYDISDYENIDPRYGTLMDFDRLQGEAKTRHIRIILDMVLNHTSDKDKWFVESASSRDNPKADWYVWNSGIPVTTPGVNDYQKKYQHEGMVPPNNWVSGFGGSAWNGFRLANSFTITSSTSSSPTSIGATQPWRRPCSTS